MRTRTTIIDTTIGLLGRLLHRQDRGLTTIPFLIGMAACLRITANVIERTASFIERVCFQPHVHTAARNERSRCDDQTSGDSSPDVACMPMPCMMSLAARSGKMDLCNNH